MQITGSKNSENNIKPNSVDTYFVLILLCILLIPLSLRGKEPFWDSVAVPSIGEATDMDIDCYGNLFITSRNGLWKSSDQGNNWFRISDSNLKMDTDPMQSFWLISIRDSNIAVTRGWEVYFSTDLGSTWRRWKKDCSLNGNLQNIYKMHWDNKNTLYCVDNIRSTLLFSDYSDTTWHAFDKNFDFEMYMDLSVLNDSCIAVLGIHDLDDDVDIIDYTTDKGNTWNEFRNPGRTFNSICFYDKNEIYIGTSNGLKLLTGGKELKSISPAGIYVYDMYIPDKKNIYLETGSNFLYFSLDSGKTWKKSINGLEKLQFATKIRTDKFGYVYFMSYLWGIYRSTDKGDSWHSSNNGFFSAPIKGIAFDKDKNAYLASNDLYKSTDNGRSWQSLGFEGQIFKSVFVNKKNYLFASSWRAGGLLRSKDEGITWDTLTNGLVTDIVFNQIFETRKGYLFGRHGLIEGGPIYVSSDDGDSWNVLLRADGYPFHGWYLSEASDGSLLLIDNDSYIYRSTNNGDTWDTVYKRNEWFGKDPWVNCPILFLQDTSVGFASVLDDNDITHIIKTTDNGITWSEFQTFDTDTIDFYFDSFYALDSLKNIYWLGYPGGYLSQPRIVKTDITGNIIDTISSDMLTTNIDRMYISPDGYVWGAIDYNSLYRSSDRYVSVKEQFPESSEITISNSPNPFSDKTEISYSLPEHGLVSITISDILGRQVFHQPPEYKDVGRQSFSFISDGLAGGAYFLTIASGRNRSSTILYVLKK